MKICAKCQTENREEDKFCGNCRSPLAAKEEPASGPEVAEDKPKNVQMCPRCKLLHEKGEFCVKCKTKLVPKSPSEGEGKLTVADILKEKEPPAVQVPPQELETLNGVSLRKEDLEMGFGVDTLKDLSLSLKLPGSPGRVPEDKISTASCQEHRSRILSPAPLALAGIILLIAAVSYFLSTRRSESKASTPREQVVLTPAVSLVPAIPSEGEDQETQRIKALLENIRQANLQENIELFMSCYALDCKDREEKRLSTLENWKTFDYLDLSYSVRNQTVSGNSANIQVEWSIKACQDKDGPPRQNRVVIDASLKKEGDGWRIKETKTGS